MPQVIIVHRLFTAPLHTRRMSKSVCSPLPKCIEIHIVFPILYIIGLGVKIFANAMNTELFNFLQIGDDDSESMS
jgi:hypothetical protein